MTDYIRMENIDKTYGDVEALNSVALDVEQGRIVTLVGVNGSGKTTLLRILAGLEEPVRGSIIFNQEKVGMKELRQISTLVFQKAVMFNTSVFDNISFGLKVKGFGKEQIKRRVSQALASVGLVGFEKRKAKRLSGGEQQRVALARAFVIEPRILLLDEPTANLDPTNAVVMENAIKTMGERKECAILLATHNLHQAKRLSNKMIHIHHGRIIETADPEDFFTHPRSRITKNFINGELQF